MDAAGGGITADNTTSTTPSTPFSRWTLAVSRQHQHLLDKLTPLVLHRWIALSTIAFAYIIRAYFLQGFYIVTYGLGIYILNLLIAFLSPKVDPELHDVVEDSGGGALPIRGSDEYRPFVRRLPEFQFWYSLTKAFYIAFILTFFSIFDVPVFWPILLFYFVMLFTLTMKKQILHMIKYKYVPFSVGKQRYDGKRTSSSDSLNLPSD